MLAPLRSRPLARAWSAVTALLVVVALCIQVPLAVTGEGGYFYETWDRALNVFAFFTIQSNLLVALSCLLVALDPDRDGALRRWLRHTALVAITVTAVVFHLLLAGLQDLSGWGVVGDALVHTVVPLLMVLGWVLFGPRGRTRWWTVVASLLFPLAWVAFTLWRGPVVGGFWPYPFVDVDTLGLERVLWNVAGVGVVFWLLAAAAHLLDRALTRRADAAPEPVPAAVDR